MTPDSNEVRQFFSCCKVRERSVGVSSTRLLLLEYSCAVSILMRLMIGFVRCFITNHSSALQRCSSRCGALKELPGMNRQVVYLHSHSRQNSARDELLKNSCGTTFRWFD